jgi:hypothetical protein
MKLFYSIILSVLFFFTSFSSVLMASRPATKTIYDSKNKTQIVSKVKSNNNLSVPNVVNSQFTTYNLPFFISDSVQTKTETLPEKPKKNGLGMIIGGVFLTFLGIVFGVVLLLTFLLGFSIFTIGSGFYFRDIYAIAGVMLGGLIIFGLGVYMISRGRERWKAYKRYKKALKKIKNT